MPVSRRQQIWEDAGRFGGAPWRFRSIKRYFGLEEVVSSLTKMGVDKEKDTEGDESMARSIRINVTNIQADMAELQGWLDNKRVDKIQADLVALWKGKGWRCCQLISTYQRLPHRWRVDLLKRDTICHSKAVATLFKYRRRLSYVWAPNRCSR